jgi:hypothetical protein
MHTIFRLCCPYARLMPRIVVRIESLRRSASLCFVLALDSRLSHQWYPSGQTVTCM